MSDPIAGRPSALSVVVLGCDGSWPGPDGAASGYLVRSPTTSVLLDAGPGTFANFQRLGDPASLDAIIISHHHPDHWTDLYGLAVHAEFISGRTGIPVFAPEGLAGRAHLEASTVFDWHTVADGLPFGVGDITGGFHRTDHGVETLAVRLDSGGRSLGYSADSGPGWALTELGTGLDLVLCEATYTTDHEGTAGHMSGRQAGEQAKRAEAGRLVLTHRWPTIEAAAVVAEAEAIFGRPVEQAAIGKEFRL
ncbi:MAG TPA: MBL fold metallo-hydrolase [Acidimicrobiales bacterium]|jgi:ribonuclease BN (tRNA processing enzyme)|nr:MBL fold metallo-hydrolase [Acidimicrobiales bacterium]